MSQSRLQPIIGRDSRRRMSSSLGDRRATTTTPPPLPAQSHSRRVVSVTPNYRDRPNTVSRPQPSERLIPARKTTSNLVGRTDHPPRQVARHECAGNRKSPSNQDKRPPFVVGTGNSSVYRDSGGAGRYHGYATTMTESRNRSSATSSKDRRANTECVPKDSGTESKTNKSERSASCAADTTTSISSNARHSRGRVETPNATESSATAVVADPLPEIPPHRSNRKQYRPSPEECIKQVAEKLSEFAAIQNNVSDPVTRETDTCVSGDQRPTTGNDVTTDTRRRDVTGSPRPHPLAQYGRSVATQTATFSGENDASSAPRRVGVTSKKAAEVQRNGPTRLTAACRPSPTRSSLLRQALNRPGSAARQQRLAPPTRPTVGRKYRSVTDVGTKNRLQTSLRQHNVTKHGRLSGDQTSHDAAAQPTNAKHQTSRRFGGDHVAKPAVCAVKRELRDVVTSTTTTRVAGQRSVDAESSRTYNVDDGSSSPSSVSTPRTYVVEVLDDTDDESSRQTSPRIADRPTRSCRRRRPKSLDSGQYSRPSVSKDAQPEVGYLSHQSSSAETFVRPKATSLSPESLRRRRRGANTTSPNRTAAVVSSAPNLPELRRPPLRRWRPSASSAGEVTVSGHADPLEMQDQSREDDEGVRTTKSIVSDDRRTSRLPRLVRPPHKTLPNTSTVSPAVVHAPRPRSFRYSRFHRRAVDAMVPSPLRDVPWRWAWKAHTGINQ